MSLKFLTTSTIAASLLFAPVPLIMTPSPAQADGKDVIAGMIVGGILGAAINEDHNRRKAAAPRVKSTKTRTRAPSMSAEQRAANVEVQHGLNYFGWNVGSADGVLGQRSRSAIRDYQAFLGHGMTGSLTGDERMILVTSHQRAMAGGASIQQIVAGSVHGVRGLLLAQKAEMYGQPMMAGGYGAATAPAFVGAEGQLAAAAPVAAPAPVIDFTAPEEEIVEAASAAPSLPSFMSASGANGALSADCARVASDAASRGGYATTATMSDANTALGEQFCLTRAAAVTQSNDLASKISGASAQEIAAQCSDFGLLLKEQVASVSLRAAPDVLTGVEAFILNSGMSPAEISGTAKVCLGSGYQHDQMDVAIGSALVLTAVGETAYGELIGHHLARGFGATQRNDLAFGWYEIALGAMQGGKDILIPGQQGRGDLVRKAAYTISGRSGELAPKETVTEVAMPSFITAPEVEQKVVATKVVESAPEAAPANAQPESKAPAVAVTPKDSFAFVEQ